MNYYRRYPGDYARDTRHLTLAEHGAYTLLLDYLYGTQRVLPGLALGLYRICGAHSEEEKRAVDSVVDQFFEKTAEGYVNNRVTSDITKAESRIKAAIENGKKGGRRHQYETQKEPSGLAEGQADSNPQKSYPTTNHQPPIEEKKHIRAWPADLFLSQAMTEYAIGGGVPDPGKEFAAWKDDCLAHNRKYANWMAAWRTRVRNYEKFSGGKSNGAIQPKSFDAIRREEGDASTRRLLERNRARVGSPGEALPALPGRVGKADLH